MDHVNPPRGPVTSPDEPLVASTTSSTHVASAAPDGQSGGFFSNLARKVGLGGAAADASASLPPQPQPVASAKPKANEAKHHEPQHPEAAAKVAATPKSDTKQASARPPLKPSLSGNATRLLPPRKTIPSPVRSRSYRPIRSRTASRRRPSKTSPASARRTRFPMPSRIRSQQPASHSAAFWHRRCGCAGNARAAIY